MAKRKFLLASFLFFSFYFSNYDDSFASGFGEDEKTIYHYDERSSTLDAPAYITFNPNYRTKDGRQSPQYRFYGGNKKFWEEFHWNEFHWYSIVPRKNPKADDMNMKNMLENNQKELGCNGAYLVSSSDCNLKKGRQDPRTRKFMGNNSGTTLITVGPYKGKYYEWRYLECESDEFLFSCNEHVPISFRCIPLSLLFFVSLFFKIVLMNPRSFSNSSLPKFSSICSQIF